MELEGFSEKTFSGLIFWRSYNDSFLNYT